MPPLALQGVVQKVGVMSKTATVLVTRYVEHPLTHKSIARSKKYLVHDPQEKLKLHDMCVIRNCPPVSARKRFVLEEIVKPAPAAPAETLEVAAAA
ncbi:nucleic acid-binding protein [Ceratobasidium sp. AG-I]|nr:nucleic acid-binding protein [Ceratobasidium sp. AG-I]